MNKLAFRRALALGWVGGMRLLRQAARFDAAVPRAATAWFTGAFAPVAARA
jgi:hypothetical protein